jgi:two-component system response regulator MprA
MAMTTPHDGPSILVVDDEQAIRLVLEMTLTRRGYRVLLASDGEEALRTAARLRPDLIVLDVLLPGTDGLTVCRRLRARGDEVPVLMLTARDAIGDRVTGLETGADDYVLKPFVADELMARISALLRRSEVTRSRRSVLTFGGLRMDITNRQVTRDGRSLNLTRTEFALLELFLARPGQVLRREWLITSLWGEQGGPTSNTVDVYVMYLRRKLEVGGLPRLLRTVRGVGYILETGASTQPTH